MSAAVSGIGPLSVRYAAQIRELLFTQAIRKMAAEEEAARVEAAAEKAAAREPRPVEDVAVKLDIRSEPPPPSEPVKQAAESAPATVPPAQIFDMKA